MAKFIPIITGAPGEPPHETEISRGFQALLEDIYSFIIAEIEYGEVGYSDDPAFQDWQRDAERTYEQMTASLHRFHTLTCRINEDAPLQRMAWLIDEILGHEEPGGARKLCDKMLLSFFEHYSFHGIGPTGLHRSALLAQARYLVIAMVNLPLFDGGEDPDPVSAQSPDFF